MAGSYNHCVDEFGRLLSIENIHIEDLGEAYEAITEMYGMIWYLAEGHSTKVNDARESWRVGLDEFSPRGKREIRVTTAYTLTKIIEEIENDPLSTFAIMQDGKAVAILVGSDVFDKMKRRVDGT